MTALNESAGTVGLTPSSAPTASSRSMVEVVARKFGTNPFKQLSEIWRLKNGQTKINPAEYYEYELYRPDFTLAQKKEFVGERGSFQLNLELSPPAYTNMRKILSDKVALTTLMAGLGLPTTKVQACFHPFRGFGAVPTLRSAAEIRAFLTGPAKLPLFGKPIQGEGAHGSALIVRIDGDDVRLGNGATVKLDTLCAEIAAETRAGYVFQDAVTPHPAVAALTGSSGVSTVRVVTVNETDTPRVLYTAWKLPSPTAMSDNFWQKGSLISLVDPASGIVQKVRYGTGVDSQWIDSHPVTGAPIKGITVPHWQKVLDLAVAAHSVVPDNGLLGWDIALTPEGATLIECNENTGHALYQLACGRGILNADFLPVFAAIKARNAKMMTAFAEAQKSYARAKAKV